MKKKSNLLLSILFYLLSFILLTSYLVINYISYLMLYKVVEIIVLVLICLFIYFGGFFLSKYRKDNKPMKVNMWIYFILYLALLFSLTLFDPTWGRNGFKIINWTKEQLAIYLNTSFNIIPFKTIIGYVKDMFTSLLDTSVIFVNLLGNIVCLMPLALFIPMLFKKVNNTKKFIICILCVTLGIELFQFITLSGSCDIDDIILNTLGAYIMYRILNIKDVKLLVKNVFKLEKNKLNKQKLLKVFIPLIIIIFICTGFYIVGRKYYDDNMDDWVSKRNYKVEIVDESENCESALELFYETELYEYYFECIKSDKVYAIINDTEKYLVKDLLNDNPTDYVIHLSKFENAGLKFIKKEKYTKIIDVEKGSIYLDNIKISDESIFEIGYGEQEVSDTEIKNELFIIPKKSGTATLTIKYGNTRQENDIVKTKVYKINVSENMEIKYEEKN